MPQTITLTLSPQQAASPEVYVAEAARRVGISKDRVALARIVKRSVDARKAPVKVNLTLELYIDSEAPAPEEHFDYPDVSGHEEVIIVGGGPAGLFCALRLIELGYRPVVLERGKEVSARRRDVAVINRNGILDPDSNYAFGEGAQVHFPMVNFSRAAKNAVITTRRCEHSYFMVPTLRYFMRLIRI